MTSSCHKCAVTSTITVTCRSFFETDGYVFETGSVTELCDWFALHIHVSMCGMRHALTFIHGLKAIQCFDILARPDVVWQAVVCRRFELEMTFCKKSKRLLVIDMGSDSKVITKYQTNLVLDLRNGAESIFAIGTSPKQLLCCAWSRQQAVSY